LAKITVATWQPADSAEADSPIVNKMADNENFDSRRSSFVDDNVRFGSRRQSHNLYRHASNISQYRFPAVASSRADVPKSQFRVRGGDGHG
jgi:hypothetical protein